MAESGAVMDIKSVPEAIEWQARHAEEGGAPGTARVIRGLLALEDSQAATARRIFGWQGLTLKDAMPLRINGGLHNLVLTGEDTRLGAVYAALTTDQAAVDALVRELVETYDALLLPWLDGPPQTNEAGRSASLMAGLLWLAERVPSRFEMLELGSSAGINTMMERYFFDLGGVKVGPETSPMWIVPEWKGNAPPATSPQIVAIRGCDIAPVDLSDPEAAVRLKSYVWPEAIARMGRIDAAVELASETPPDVVKMDAAGFVAEALARPQDEGVTRVLFHSIVWQYIPDDQQQAIRDAMRAAAESATEDEPLAWVSLETNRKTFRHELHVTYWPGGEEPALLACAHPHGAWVEWLYD
ncbi:DUF2332 domain-containing protein [Parerythrobacter aestuarii]|uniref:DUF2332 domain-containing protein n=1 Tax=Parerythrobacter aestuarii TaxID=3020909 RepID=UPI0024DE65B0|nr:DUF2332 domain-containing protein [Parerythrobacter aestuarii]